LFILHLSFVIARVVAQDFASLQILQCRMTNGKC
jgi:hypothetical protein